MILFLYAKLKMFALYHGGNMLHYDEMMICFVLDQHVELDFYSASLLHLNYSQHMLLHSDTQS